MLKKAGIVVAASAAALLAVSPLAFAGDKGGEAHGHGHGGPDSVQLNSVDKSATASGLIAIGAVNALNDVNVCPAVPVGVGIGNLLGLLGSGTATETPSANGTTCVNDNSVDQDNDD